MISSSKLVKSIDFFIATQGMENARQRGYLIIS